MNIDINVPEFTQAEVVKVTGVAEKTMQNWASRGLLQLAEQYPGRAKRRLYSAADVFKIAIMLSLVNLGISANEASRYANGILRRCFGDLNAEERGRGLTDLEKSSDEEIAVLTRGGPFGAIHFTSQAAKKPLPRLGRFPAEIRVYHREIILDVAEKLEAVIRRER